MRNRNYCWELGVQIVSKRLCHRQFFLLIVCILESWLLQLMLLLTVARLQFSIIQGTNIYIYIYNCIVEVN